MLLIIFIRGFIRKFFAPPKDIYWQLKPNSKSSLLAGKHLDLYLTWSFCVKTRFVYFFWPCFDPVPHTAYSVVFFAKSYPNIWGINLIIINNWFQICTYNFDFKHFDHLQMVRDEVTKFPQKDRDKCAKSFCDKSCNKKEAFPPKKGTRPLCPLFSSCLEPGAIPAFILSANWVSCWFSEVFVCRQPEKWPKWNNSFKRKGL